MAHNLPQVYGSSVLGGIYALFISNKLHVVNWGVIFVLIFKDFPTCLLHGLQMKSCLVKSCFCFVSTITESIMGHLPVL